MEEGIAIVRGNEKTPTATTKISIKSLWNMMLDYAVEYEIVERNYARSFVLSDEIMDEMSKNQQKHIPFTNEEMKLLWEHVDDTYGIDAILVQCYSGWRPQEIGLLELEKVDLENWFFQGGMKTESGSERTVPIHSKIRALVLHRYKEAEQLGSKYLFNYTYTSRRHSNTMFTYERFRERFAHIKNELKLDPDHRPHDGRKHFVTAAKRDHVDEYAIKYIVGHRISDITEKVYTQREPAWLQTKIEKSNEALVNSNKSISK